MRLVQGRISAADGILATVEVTVSEGGCGRCHEPGGCGATNISRALGARLRSLTVENTLNLNIGDLVTVGIEDESVSRIATRVYTIPLIGLIAGGAIGELFFGSTGSIAAIVGALFGFVTTATISRYALPKATPLLRMMDVKMSSCVDQISRL